MPPGRLGEGILARHTGAEAAAQPDKTLIEETFFFGINLGGGAYYSGTVLTKLRAHETFEDTTYRQCHFGPVNARQWMARRQRWKALLDRGLAEELALRREQLRPELDGSDNSCSHWG